MVNTRAPAPAKKKVQAPTNKGKGKVENQKQDVAVADEDMPLSQQSNESDENQKELMETIAKQYAAAMKKKRSQKEQKFLQDAENELKEANARTAQEIQDAVNEIEQVYRTFLLEYAACEDSIRKKWEKIQQEQEKLTKAVKERLRRDEEAVKVASSMHVEGLTRTKRSLKAFQETIDQLLPTQ